MGIAENFKKLLGKGKMEFCSMSGQYYHRSDMNPNGKGGFIAKKYDLIRHENQKSKFRKGSGWYRGI